MCWCCWPVFNLPCSAATGYSFCSSEVPRVEPPPPPATGCKQVHAEEAWKHVMESALVKSSLAAGLAAREARKTAATRKTAAAAAAATVEGSHPSPAVKDGGAQRGRRPSGEACHPSALTFQRRSPRAGADVTDLMMCSGACRCAVSR